MIDDDKRLLPVFATPAHLEIYDIQDAVYDMQLSVTTLAGLINRGQPRVYLLSNNDADSLFNALLAHVPHEHVNTGELGTLDAMLQTYRDTVKGMVIYDPAMPDSVNVATTMAGLRGAIVVSPRQAATLQQKPYQLPIVADLRTYHWKNRLQAYRWAEDNLLKEASKQVVAGLNPTIAGGLRSYLVATRSFVYWLNPLHILPDPVGGWAIERCLMKRIMRAYPPGTSHLGWFINEFAGVDIASKAALYTLPSDYFFNLEVWSAVQPSVNMVDRSHEGRLRRPRPYTVRGSEPARIYISFTISDGDNLQFNQHRMYRLWQDTARGTIPLGWTIAPTLIEAAPTLAAYYRKTATQNDELIAGPSGAAYMWPSYWPAERLSAYLQRTGALMQQMDLHSIEVLDGLLSRLFPFRAWQEQYAKSLSPFGVRCILTGDSYRRGDWRVVSGVPVIKNLGLAKNAAQTLALIQNNTPVQIQGPAFLNVYIYAWSMTPTDISKLVQGLDNRYTVVTPGQLGALIAQVQEGR
ncbi:MAG TPA: GxGYxYP domain-containing protein [Ktedonobacteraceae bacterium]|nr:GxGYxYP domain-containing protein [Ktedonobacteraceae bacterium]